MDWEPFDFVYLLGTPLLCITLLGWGLGFY
jgi:hypothetical protein